MARPSDAPDPALSQWLEKGVRSAPAAGPLFRVLAGLLSALFVLVAVHWLWRLADGGVGVAAFDPYDIPAGLAMIALFALFGVLAVTGSVPVWLWKAWLRLCGRL